MSFGQWKPTITLKYQPFPKQACIHKIINEPIDSNPQDDIYNLGEHPCQKASLCSFFKGSYTLEAAVIIPVAAVFFLTLLFFFRVLQIQTEVQEALNYASRKQHVKHLRFHRKRGFWYLRKRILERSWERTACRKNIFAVENMRLRWQNPICQEIILICRLIITLKFQLAFLR